ncbi:hypothetical protein F5B17DRAFT_243499 [Nemania serpens]|nr:hypothetical protein F5B17DRAFT_243499 [Nemania serpens]
MPNLVSALVGLFFFFEPPPLRSPLPRQERKSPDGSPSVVQPLRCGKTSCTYCYVVYAVTPIYHNALRSYGNNKPIFLRRSSLLRTCVLT